MPQPAQPPKPAAGGPSREAAPPVVTGRDKLALDTKEPRGLLLKRDPGKSGQPAGSLRVEWGATSHGLKEAMSSLSSLPVDDRLRCSQHGGEVLCFPSEGILGWADLDGVLKGPGRAALLFAPDGRFYHYLLDLPRSDFETMRSSLTAKLGAPAADTKSKAQDKAGSSFDQRLITWNLRHVSVVLLQANPAHTEESEVHVVYTPIAERTQ